MDKYIDYWVNPFWPGTLDKAMDIEELATVIKWWHMEDRWKTKSTEEYVDLMNASGVDKSLVPSVQMKSYMNQVMINDFDFKQVASMINKQPGKLYGLYGINPYSRMKGVKELEIAVKQYGFVGAHLHTYGFGIPLNHRDYYPYYAKCEELGVPVVMQVGHSAESMPSECGRPILVDDISLYFRELKIVCSHTGWPWVEELVAIAWKHSNVYIGTAAHAPRYWDPSLVAFLSTRGKGKVLWGSDFPVLYPKECVDQIDAMKLKEDTRSLLLHDVAAKIFKL